LLLLVIFLGAARYQYSLPELSPSSIAWYNDREEEFVVEGIVDSFPEERDQYTYLRVRVERISPVGEIGFTPVRGSLLARIPIIEEWKYGDRVRLEGLLSTPFESEEFSYRNYLARQGIYSYFACAFCMSCPAWVKDDCVRLVQHGQGNPVLAAIYALRERAVKVVYDLFPDPEASLLAGILLGIESGIPEQVQQAFNATGTTHIIAISGFNFAIVAGLFSVFFGRLLGRWRGMLATFLGIAFYAILAGAEASVVRAAIMGGLSGFAIQVGRRQHALNTLAFVAAIMTLFDPQVLWNVGFQLSFMATLGLMLYAGPLAGGFTKLLLSVWSWKSASASLSPALPDGAHIKVIQKISRPVSEYILFTLAAQLTTLPITLYYFQRLSLISSLANLMILPAQPPVMVLGGLTTILGLIYLPLGHMISYLSWPFLVYTIRLVEFMTRVQGSAYATGRVSMSVVILFYTLLFGITWWYSGMKSWLVNRLEGLRVKLASSLNLRTWMGNSKKLDLFLSRSAPAILLILVALTIVVWQRVLSRPDGRLHLTVLDVGSGDALLIRSPTGRNLLVDGGSSPSALSDALGRRLPFGMRELDFLVVAAAGEEQLGALPRVLERFPPDRVLWAGAQAGTPSARRLQLLLADSSVTEIPAQIGQSLDLGEGAWLYVLSVGERGAVLLLEWGSFRALLPIGLDFDSLGMLQQDRRQLPVTALLLAESGYAPLNPPKWIWRWKPQVVLLSVGAGDREGRPDSEILQTLEGYTLLRTDRNGWIELSTDGERLWMEVERW
jgi:competence protein ComEC